MKKRNQRREEGMALLLALGFMIMAGIFITWTYSRSFNNKLAVDNYVDFQQVFMGLEAAVAQSKADLDTAGDGWIGITAWNANYGTPAFGDGGVTPVSLASLPQVQYFAYATSWASDGVDNIGDGNIDFGPETDFASIEAFARMGNIVRRVETIVELSDANGGGPPSVWDDALFSGLDPASVSDQSLEQSVEIHGSLHVLGDGISPGDTVW